MGEATTNVMTVKGLALTKRMADMGITGVVQTTDGWMASFKEYGGAMFLMPKPVSDWFLHLEFSA